MSGLLGNKSIGPGGHIREWTRKRRRKPERLGHSNTKEKKGKTAPKG